MLVRYEFPAARTGRVVLARHWFAVRGEVSGNRAGDVHPAAVCCDPQAIGADTPAAGEVRIVWHDLHGRGALGEVGQDLVLPLAIRAHTTRAEQGNRVVDQMAEPDTGEVVAHPCGSPRDIRVGGDRDDQLIGAMGQPLPAAGPHVASGVGDDQSVVARQQQLHPACRVVVVPGLAAGVRVGGEHVAAGWLRSQEPT